MEFNDMTLSTALFMEAFCTIHMTIFVIWPISAMIDDEGSHKMFWTWFIGRIIILLYCDFYVSPGVAIADFMLIFIGGFIMTPLVAFLTSRKSNGKKKNILNTKIVVNSTSNIKNYDKPIIPKGTSNLENSYDLLNYIELDPSELIELREFLSKDENNTVIVTPFAMTWESATEPSRKTSVRPKKMDFEKIIIRQKTFKVMTVNSQIGSPSTQSITTNSFSVQSRSTQNINVYEKNNDAVKNDAIKTGANIKDNGINIKNKNDNDGAIKYMK
jgi:hypothetical protein